MTIVVVNLMIKTKTGVLVSEESNVEAMDLAKIKEIVKQLFVYDEEIKLIADAKKDFFKEWCEDNPEVPKKELMVALSLFKKKDLDVDIVNELYEEIVDLIGTAD